MKSHQADSIGNADSERLVVGEILAEPGTVRDGRALDECHRLHLTPDAFTDANAREVYKAIIANDAERLPTDHIAVADRLRKERTFDGIGGTDFLQQLVDASIPSETTYHIEKILDAQRRRQFAVAINRARVRLNSAGDWMDTRGIVGELTSEIDTIEDGFGSATISFRDAVHDAFDRLRNPEKAEPGLPTGFFEIDAKLNGGMRRGDLVIIAARPSVGKTSLAMNMAECVALGKSIGGERNADGEKHPVGIFSLEMTVDKLCDRMAAGRAGFGTKQLASAKNGWLTKYERERLTEAEAELCDAPIFIDPTPDLEIDDLCSRARRMKRKHGIELFVVDYLGQCGCREYAANKIAEVTQISKRLKAMAKELKVPVVVLSQLNRGGGDKGDDKPTLSRLRDSGAIEQDADIVILLHRENESDRANGLTEYCVIANVAKNRNGATGEVRLNFNAECTRFSDRPASAD